MDVQTLGTIAGTIVATLAVARLLAGSSWNLSGRITSIEGSVKALQVTMQSMQNEISRLGDVMERMADFKGDMRVMNIRVSAAEEDIRLLQRGEGMVLPLKSPYENP